MSAETFSTALFLITAVIAAGVLINAIFPVVYTMAGTFSSASHTADQNIRTDFKIVSYVGTAGTPGKVQIWLKNVGSAQLTVSDIERSDVMCGNVGAFDRLVYGSTGSGKWQYYLSDLNSNGYWDSGETVEITAQPAELTSDNDVYFQFVLPSGIWRSTQFSLS
jgi:archaeal flagellar protein FlaG